MTEPQISDEVIEAAARAWLGIKPGAPFSMEQFRVTYPHACIGRALAAAVPHLHRQWEAELRAQIADEQARRSSPNRCVTPADCKAGEPCMLARGCNNDPRLRSTFGAQPGGQP